MPTRANIVPYARSFARVLGLFHILACLYCVFNLARYCGYAFSVGIGDAAFFAAYLTLAFSLAGSIFFVGYLARRARIGLAMFGCCQAAMCAVGLAMFQRTMFDTAALILYGISGFVLKYAAPPSPPSAAPFLHDGQK